ncbi:flagellar hook-associated protein 3 [Romboutsia maritimum]|uniref:Flagellar hook-associated protein 3 n=1 Tax=Romboutsia maritimum TaxID=2020948 RepID=A0A371IVL0_9FIRM|nr:flagellar hook-associated protein FlgL [Romboutsia maritimum]RDY24501.1 flagellar hook-associated protein 3 [Romboutsia maritimum]
MRITNSAMTKNYLFDLQNNLQKMDNINTKLNTGKMVNRVSDDPHKAVKILSLNSEIKNVEKYNYNIDETVGWMNNTDAALNELGTTVSDIKALITKAGNGAYGPDELKALSTEMNEKMKELGEVLNTTHGGKFIFGGDVTDEKPAKVVQNPDGTVSLTLNNSSSGNLNASISDGIVLDYNVSAVELVGSDEKSLKNLNSISEIFNKMGKGTETDEDKNKLMGDLMKGVDTFFNHALNNRTEMGARVNTAECVKNSNEENILNMKSILSLDQDVDYSKTYIEWKSAELIYTASVQVGAKLSVPTILDYLR